MAFFEGQKCTSNMHSRTVSNLDLKMLLFDRASVLYSESPLSFIGDSNCNNTSGVRDGEGWGGGGGGGGQ